MKRIRVGLGNRSYDVLIGRGLLADGSAERICKLASGGRIAFVSDQNVWQAGGAVFFEALKRCSVVDNESFAVVIPPGEASKNLSELGSIAEAFAVGGLTRGGLVCAMGGGVVGDLAGFAAATWMRGVRYVQIPTSLLAMVDSSVGGKTAVDIPSGKNLIGAFHQPSLVLIDPDKLRTLPEREFKSGMAEVIKYGAIESEELFDKLEKLNPAYGAADAAYEDIIADCVRIKAEIVAEDELDNGRRAILNFGHTFGHAIETKYGFKRYCHGEAVAIGMRFAAYYGEAEGVTGSDVAARLDGLLNRWGLMTAERSDGLADLIRLDKKTDGAKVNLILLERIGRAGAYRTDFLKIKKTLEGLRF